MRDEADFDYGIDLPPEFCTYRDEGCDLAASCLDCPFPHCIYEERNGRQSLLKMVRDGEIVRLFHNEQKSVNQLAAIFKVSVRTVQRALKGTILPLPPGETPHEE